MIFGHYSKIMPTPKIFLLELKKHFLLYRNLNVFLYIGVILLGGGWDG